MMTEAAVGGEESGKGCTPGGATLKRSEEPDRTPPWGDQVSAEKLKGESKIP